MQALNNLKQARIFNIPVNRVVWSDALIFRINWVSLGLHYNALSVVKKESGEKQKPAVE